MKMTANQIRIINKRIERTSKACGACPFYNNVCVEGLIPILRSKKIVISKFRRDTEPYNYFNCNRAYKELLRHTRSTNI